MIQFIFLCSTLDFTVSLKSSSFSIIIQQLKKGIIELKHINIFTSYQY